MTQSDLARSAPHLRLVARDGVRLDERLAAVETPEEPLAVSFGGITEAEQQKALAAFPGGRRFHIVGRRN